MSEKPRKETQKTPSSKEQGVESLPSKSLDAITEKLRAAYQKTVDEDVPKKFSELLAKLRKDQDKGKNDG